MTNCILIGAPVQAGASQAGCMMGPDALRTAGLADALKSLGFNVSDLGNLLPDEVSVHDHPNRALKNLSEMYFQKYSHNQNSSRRARHSSYHVDVSSCHKRSKCKKSAQKLQV